jgi:aerobic carbon-monoxide dehydrogenase medium subunit
MKPASFEYFAPSTIGATLELLKTHREDAKLLAGGQSLVPMLNFRIARFKCLVDINGVSDLSYIRLDDDLLRIGALTRYRAIENSPKVEKAAPLLSEATKSVAHLPVRTRGTIGGSLAHADPAAEYPAVLMALGATVVVQSHLQERHISAEDFIRGLFTTALEPDELITEIRIPTASPNQLFAFEEFARRPGDLALMGIAVHLEIKGDVVEDAKIAAFGGRDGACRVPTSEKLLIGRTRSTLDIERVAAATSSIPVHSDTHATEALRRHLAVTLAHRALLRALAT